LSAAGIEVPPRVILHGVDALERRPGDQRSVDLRTDATDLAIHVEAEVVDLVAGAPLDQHSGVVTRGGERDERDLGDVERRERQVEDFGRDRVVRAPVEREAVGVERHELAFGVEC